MRSGLDHVVFVASTLDEGVAWCAATFGITPAGGGAHPKMGTHNRLFSTASTRFPRAYAEILAIDPSAPAPARRRWFDLDDPALQAAISAGGPRLHGFAWEPGDLAGARAALLALGLDPGPAIAASRQTPRGLLEWQLTVPDDGRRLLGGVAPALIQWGQVHPSDSLPASGVTLERLRLAHPRAAELAAALDLDGVDGLDIEVGPPLLTATFGTPRGPVVLT